MWLASLLCGLKNRESKSLGRKEWKGGCTFSTALLRGLGSSRKLLSSFSACSLHQCFNNKIIAANKPLTLKALQKETVYTQVLNFKAKAICRSYYVETSVWVKGVSWILQFQFISGAAAEVLWWIVASELPLVCTSLQGKTSVLPNRTSKKLAIYK